jgi:hypothetical protein
MGYDTILRRIHTSGDNGTKSDCNMSLHRIFSFGHNFLCSLASRRVSDSVLMGIPGRRYRLCTKASRRCDQELLFRISTNRLPYTVELYFVMPVIPERQTHVTPADVTA